MAFTLTSDISRMIAVGQKEIFLENFNAFPVEYPEFTVDKKAKQKVETYDSMGNLAAGYEKQEGAAITYSKVEQAYQTTVTCKTWANGFSHSFESIHYDKYAVMNSAKAKELARTMRELEEARAVYWVDNAFATAVLTDGVVLCSDSRPLYNVPGTYNDTLTTGALSPDNLKVAYRMFHRFKNHQGGPMVSYATDGLTHAVNQTTVEEIELSTNKAYELSNTKNRLQKVNWHYSHYMSSETAWLVWDKRYDHILFQWFLKTQFDSEEDFDTKNMKFSGIAIYQTGAVPNIGIVGSLGT